MEKNQNQPQSVHTLEGMLAVFQEANKRLEQTERTLKEMFAETDRKFAENAMEFKETKKTLKEMFAETDRKFQETRESIKELGNHIGGISNSIGDMAEDYFYNTFKKDKTFANQQFDKIKRNVIYDRDNDVVIEYDILLFNGTNVAIIEVKFNAKPQNIKVEKLLSRIDTFKVLYPEYKNYGIYLGVAALSFKKQTAKELHSAGIATIHQVGKKMVVYDKEVKCFN